MSHSTNLVIPILIASTLKPVKDVRAFGKLAISFGETSKYRVNIIGFSDEKIEGQSGIRLISGIRNFFSSTERILFQFKFAYHLVRLKPKLLICCTFELLPVATFFKRLLNYKLVYDVQENYRCNLGLNPMLSEFKKKLSQKVIQWTEGIPGIDLYLLAEKCYQWEMPEKKPYLVLENNYAGNFEQQSSFRLIPEKPLKFCITGTLSPYFGTLEGIRWFKNLISKFPQFTLELIGHCPWPEYLDELRKEIKDQPQIHARVSVHPISHDEIIQTLKNSDVSLLPYRLHPCIRFKMPTKLYECAALGIPVFITPNPMWENFYGPFKGGFSVDFNQPEQAVTTFQNAVEQVYFSNLIKVNVLWKNEKVRFLEAIDELMRKSNTSFQ